MRKLIILMVCVMGMCQMCFSQTTKKYAYCKVIECKNRVDITFTDEVRYLGVNYERMVLFADNRRLEFVDGQDAVSYLSTSWSWELSGNPTQLRGDAIMWVLKHEIDYNTANFNRNMKALEEGYRRYGDDDMYYSR